MNKATPSPVVFVTSFRPDMYHATGKHLIDSFLRHCDDSKMFMCTEAFTSDTKIVAEPRITIHDITQDPTLVTWLSDNRDIIPQHLGGAAPVCDCTVAGFGVEELHREGCINGWYNRNASRWFRKLIALRAAVSNFPEGLLIWIDSDCRFKCDLFAKTIVGWSQGASGFYFKSPQRKVMESGLIGLNLVNEGGELLREVLVRYLSGSFRKDPRWDDGAQLQYAVDKRKDIKMIDLAPTALAWQAEVIAASVVGRYIEHYRGTHGPVLRLMT